jgi:hypothetical protein
MALAFLAFRRRRQNNNEREEEAKAISDDLTADYDEDMAPRAIEASFVDEEDENDDIASVSFPSPSRPSQAHSGLNVHSCTSATCEECVRKDRVQFLSTDTGDVGCPTIYE